jgi:hypothetical protein
MAALRRQRKRRLARRRFLAANSFLPEQGYVLGTASERGRTTIRNGHGVGVGAATLQAMLRIACCCVTPNTPESLTAT